MQAIIHAAAAVAKAIDTDKLAQTLVAKSFPQEDVAASRRRKAAEEQKAWLADACHRSCLALLDLKQQAAAAAKPETAAAADESAADNADADEEAAAESAEATVADEAASGAEEAPGEKV